MLVLLAIGYGRSTQSSKLLKDPEGSLNRPFQFPLTLLAEGRQATLCLSWGCFIARWPYSTREVILFPSVFCCCYTQSPLIFLMEAFTIEMSAFRASRDETTTDAFDGT